MKQFLVLLVCFSTSTSILFAQPTSNHGSKFEALGSLLPSPNEYRTASGAPGPKYWQQRCDYDIECTLDQKNLKLFGKETITYYNNSPDNLNFLWLQLDENEHSSTNHANYQSASAKPSKVTTNQLDDLLEGNKDNEMGDKITKITDALGKPLKYTINKTMMRVELPAILKPGQKFVLKIDWNYKIPDRLKTGGRGGYEFFPEDKNYLFTMTQWYPRLCVYSDFQGWQNNQYTGRGEFALSFGNFTVKMTAPANHIIAATGECLNYQQVLSPVHFAKWQKAQTAKAPLEIVTLDDAKKAENIPTTGTKTWIYKANNVRDFAWGSSNKFCWDAMPQMVEGKKIMCMSYYAKEAYNLYNRYSTKLVAHSIKTYSDFTIPYPYPVAISVEASNGMEYPMICFNYGRTEKDGTYNESIKNGMIGVIIHEVGHNFFPMIINSDERQWSWMDEGLNSFVEYLTEELWDNKYPTREGAAYHMIKYMSLPKEQLEPIMTNSENIVHFGPNAYTKPATALNILRETVMGRELFDYAFKEYARRWAFKHPTPADLFRTMNDASAENLDWFWRGWFFGIDACDIAIDTVKVSTPDLNSKSPTDNVVIKNIEKPLLPAFDDISKQRNREDIKTFVVDTDTALQDFYWKYDRKLIPYDSNKISVTTPSNFEGLDNAEKSKYQSIFGYEVVFRNKGGLVMPIIIEWVYKDGTKEIERIPAQVWRHNEEAVTKFFLKTKEVASIKLDPNLETADIDVSNNSWGNFSTPSKFDLFKQKKAGNVRNPPAAGNPMQKAIEKKIL